MIGTHEKHHETKPSPIALPNGPLSGWNASFCNTAIKSCVIHYSRTKQAGNACAKRTWYAMALSAKEANELLTWLYDNHRDF